MKQFLFIAITILFFSVGTHGFAQDNTAMNENTRNKTKTKADKAAKRMGQAAMQNLPMAYTATYSAQFEMGNPAHSQMVLNLIKDYETNAFALGSSFADTVTVIFPDGHVIKGLEQMTAAFKQSRSAVTEPNIRIIAAIPVRSVDKGEDWVLIWGSMGSGEPADDFHHVWRINRDGKVDFMQLFEGKSPAM